MIERKPWPPDWWRHVPRNLRCLAAGIVYMGMAASSLTLAAPLAMAEAVSETPDDAVVVTKEISGQVSTVLPSTLTIVYQKKKGIDYEILLGVGKDVNVRNMRSLSDLKFGDTVSVTYDEKQRTIEKRGDNGSLRRDTQVISRQAKVVKFLSPARATLVSVEE